MRKSKNSASVSTSISTREDIRKKLASWGEEEEEEEEEVVDEVENNNLEICFFNETASDEDEEVTRNPLAEEEDEDEDDYFDGEHRGRLPSMPRSKSEGFSLRAADPLLHPESKKLR